MKIGIDLRSLQTVSQFRGIGYYTYNIVKTLCKIDSSNEYVFFVNDDYNASDKFPLLVRLIQETEKQVVKLPVSETEGLEWKSFWESASSSIFFEMENLDILHIASLFEAEAVVGLPSINGKIIVTLYDLIPLVLEKQYFNIWSLDWKKHYMGRIGLLKIYCDTIIAISECTKQDAVRLIGCPPEKIEVVHLGVIDNTYKIKDANLLNREKEKLGITEKFILFTAAEDHRKNFEKLIRAFAIFQREYADNCQLVITGKSSLKWQEQQLKLGRSLNIDSGKLVFTGFVSDEELKMLYHTADLFVFPSLYEGFGLPILEAMSYGTPVIAADNSSIPEVTGDAAILFDAGDEVDLAKKMNDVLSSSALREELKEKGIKNIKRFSWEKAAEDTLRIYTKAVESNYK